MSTERRIFLIKSAAPPSVEIDNESEAVYIRFKAGTVAKTLPQDCQAMHLAIDLDSRDEVIGIEAVGVKTVTINSILTILKKASVEAPSADFNRARFVPTSMTCGHVA